MANTFNAKEFMTGMIYAPIELGKHTITVQDARPVFETGEDGKDKSYLLIEMQFSNGRVSPIRFYNQGIQIAVSQIRKQLNSTEDIAFADFVKAIKGISLDVWVSKRTKDKDGNPIKNKAGEVIEPWQYNFVEPTAVTDTNESLAEESAF
jgi:hypothetical protein